MSSAASHQVSPTVVYVSVDGEIAGALVFDDQVRADAAYTMRLFAGPESTRS